MHTHELAFAGGLADRAADIGRTLFQGAGLWVRTKVDRSLVTRADVDIEAMVREQVAAAFPEDRVFGEEEGGPGDMAGRVWVVDPIDATANFARGIPIWGTLIALQVDGEGVLGVADAPMLGERYAAARGAGATLNGRPIRVSEIGVLGEAQVLHGELKDVLGGPYASGVEALLRASWRDRGFGDFWAHMLVARGAAEAMLDPVVSLWDYAALQVIVEEAGGRMTTFEGEPPRHGGSLVSTNGLVHDEVLRTIAPR